jgi:hypothetical protein
LPSGCSFPAGRTEHGDQFAPLILIPQILSSWSAYGRTRLVSMTMPATWSFDHDQRFSTLDTLERKELNR